MARLHPRESLPVWLDAEKIPTFLPLSTDMEADVCIVGGGVAGLTTAYMLAREGQSVCVLEDFEIASGQTGRTTAHFSPVLGERYFNLEKYHGDVGAQLIAQSHIAAIDKVLNIIKNENIQCDHEILDGYLFNDILADDDDDTLAKELDAVKRAGLTAHLVRTSPIKTFDTGACLRFPRQLQLHPVKYIRGLVESLLQMGVEICTNTHVIEVKGGDPATVKTKEGHVVTAKSVVVATNTPINDLFAIHTKQAPYRTYAVGFRIPKDSVPKALYWDTLDPYHYVRVQPGEPELSQDSAAYDILIVGGEDHKTGQDTLPPGNRFEDLEDWARARFPVIEETLYRWSGQVMEPVDGIAYLGHNPMDRNNVYVITGDAGNGFTHSTIGAMLITDQIMDRKNDWEEIYNPSRISLRATGEYLKENLNVAAQYGEWLATKSKQGLQTLFNGEGTVIRDGLKMVAAYKNQHGEMEYMSAACTHLGGVVQWNGVEKSWDCPCHGARYDCHGKVIEGPAVKDLEPIHSETLMGAPELVEDPQRVEASSNLFVTPIMG